MQDNRDVVEILQNKVISQDAQIQFNNEIIKNQKRKVNVARSIVAMLFWLYKAEQRNVREVMSNHYNISNKTMARLEAKRYCFDKAYKILKEQK